MFRLHAGVLALAFRSAQRLSSRGENAGPTSFFDFPRGKCKRPVPRISKSFPRGVPRFAHVCNGRVARLPFSGAVKMWIPFSCQRPEFEFTRIDFWRRRAVTSEVCGSKRRRCLRLARWACCPCVDDGCYIIAVSINCFVILSGVMQKRVSAHGERDNLPIDAERRGNLSSLVEIMRDRWEWRSRIFMLALAEIRAEGRGAALSWAWFFIRPLSYILCFWFAIGLGLRGGGEVGPDAPPYVLWLSAGIIPWMFMRSVLTKGSSAFRLKSAMVTTMRIPLSCITSIYSVSFLIVQIVLVAMLFAISLFCGIGIDVYLLQLPVLLVVMLLFWDMVALMLSTLGAISRDFAQLIGMASAPLFWI